ncbi:LIM domain containing protein [Trichuris trichiura]|uniref:LIM domain containing protein n=1 Tax=Trichuris trichiura TaxID=36087 RepID=A0A077ZIR8_TRITR|nr:LIM domain containing protein [Trichuris trichiura]
MSESYLKRSSSDYSPPRSDVSERVIYEAVSGLKRGCLRCPYCNGSLEGKLTAFVCWKFYHLDHIFCCMCNGQLYEGDDCYNRQGMPACGSCFISNFDVTCAVCEDPLGDWLVHALGSRYHPSCIRCCVCSKPLPKVYFAWKGRIYCHDHIIIRRIAVKLWWHWLKQRW